MDERFRELIDTLDPSGAGWAISGIWTSSSSPFRAGTSISGAAWIKTAT